MFRLVALWCFAGAGAGAVVAQSSAKVELRGELPLACTARIISISGGTTSPVQIDVLIDHACNGPNELRAQVLGPVAAPGQLLFTYGGRTPDSSVDGEARFRSQGGAASTQLLQIRYAGPASDADMIRQSLLVSVGPQG